MNDKERAVMQQALEALEMFAKHYSDGNEALTALREALAAEPKLTEDNISYHKLEQEPMYISESCAERGCACHYSVEVDGEPVAVYSAPVRTKDLTDAFINELHKDAQDPINFARAVIAADREKNRG